MVDRSHPILDQWERFTASGGVACYGASGTVALVKHGLSNYASGTGMSKTALTIDTGVQTIGGTAEEAL